MKCPSLRSNYHVILGHPGIDLSSTSKADHALVFIRSASRLLLSARWRRASLTPLVSTLSTAVSTPSKRLQVFDQVLLLFRSESQTKHSVVMINHCRQIRGASVLEL